MKISSFMTVSYSVKACYEITPMKWTSQVEGRNENMTSEGILEPKPKEMNDAFGMPPYREAGCRCPAAFHKLHCNWCGNAVAGLTAMQERIKYLKTLTDVAAQTTVRKSARE
ncbi:hypothetical protein NM208_g6290 [Fusarium decemcellulare]|uniref:Uncharacterized protein n=1 Tax=Fusarium decemcellulare TaxID=57161 RepID=A0ACC1SDJ9_9HYPO|nr:hypothetical protein NM208_g6290 [Fusarium decemcellulare]